MRTGVWEGPMRLDSLTSWFTVKLSPPPIYPSTSPPPRPICPGPDLPGLHLRLGSQSRVEEPTISQQAMARTGAGDQLGLGRPETLGGRDGFCGLVPR